MQSKAVPGKLKEPDAETARPNREVLANMEASSALLPAMFIPQSFGEVMEFAKLMAQSGAAIPDHLRGNPGACFAVAIRAFRWRMDPYAVAEETYFVNDRIAYQAKIVHAVVNTSGILDGRLHIEWEGEGEALYCTVTGYIRGDDRAKVLGQPIKTIKIRNSPLWVTAPRIQLGYYTTRAWARLYAPETLLGIYTPDELDQSAQRKADEARVGSAPARPALAAYARPDQGKPEITISGEAQEETQETAPATAESGPASGGTGEGPGTAAPKASAPPAASKPASYPYAAWQAVNWDGEVVEFKTATSFAKAVCDWIRGSADAQGVAGILESNLAVIGKLPDELQSDINAAHAQAVAAFDKKGGTLV